MAVTVVAQERVTRRVVRPVAVQAPSYMARRAASKARRKTGNDNRETKAGTVMVAEASPCVSPRVMSEAWPCMPPRTVGPMAPLTIAPHAVTAPHATFASALNLLNQARLGRSCKRGAGQRNRRCWGSPQQQHGATDQPGGHRSHLKSTHVIPPWCVPAQSRGTQSILYSVAATALVRRAVDWLAPAS
jgi:hypothetical protein